MERLASSLQCGIYVSPQGTACGQRLLTQWLTKILPAPITNAIKAGKFTSIKQLSAPEIDGRWDVSAVKLYFWLTGKVVTYACVRRASDKHLCYHRARWPAKHCSVSAIQSISISETYQHHSRIKPFIEGDLFSVPSPVSSLAFVPQHHLLCRQLTIIFW